MAGPDPKLPLTGLCPLTGVEEGWQAKTVSAGPGYQETSSLDVVATARNRLLTTVYGLLLIASNPFDER